MKSIKQICAIVESSSTQEAVQLLTLDEILRYIYLEVKQIRIERESFKRRIRDIELGFQSRRALPDSFSYRSPFF